MCVRRIKAIWKIFRPAIREKEALAPEIVAPLKRGLGFIHKLSAQPLRTLRLCGEPLFSNLLVGGRPAALNNPRQTHQHKRGVKIVGPTLITIYSVSPRTIVVLSPDDEASRADSPFDQ